MKAATPVERFERALAQSTRALAGDKHLDVVFGDHGPQLAGTGILLPRPVGALTTAHARRLRGYADSLALRQIHHDPAVHARYRPAGPRARELFDALEDVRFQALGANVLHGVAGNLTAALSDILERKGVREQQGSRFAALTDALALVVRERLTGEAPPEVAAGLMARWREEVETRAGGTLVRLAAVAHDQQRFALLVHELVRDFDLGYELGAAGEPRLVSETGDEPERAVEHPDGDAARQLGVKTLHAVMETDRALHEDEEASSGDQSRSDGEERRPETEAKGERLICAPQPVVADDPNRLYRVYTRAHDEIIDAGRLCDSAELTRLRAALDQNAKPLQAAVARLANRLQRRLLAQQKRRWRFDLEEGVLDAARLARVIVEPLAPLSFKDEEEGPFKDTVVTLLVDNSGSMRGRPILVAALCADVLARTLERCGVRVEVLGFTTRSWNGGQSRVDWVRAGSPTQPGRLSDVRYIVYKPADTPWRRTRRNLGLMLREDLLLENIDGEALLWAHQRLLARREPRRILLVISDGVPLDEATLSANPGGYLEQHLRAVVRWIETRTPVELAAIGIGHDVTDVYARAVAVEDASALGGALVDQLVELFDDRT